MILIMGWEREEKGNRIGVEKEKRWRGKGCKSIVSFIVVGTKNKWIFEARKLRLEVWGGERSKRKGKKERKERESRKKGRKEKRKESQKITRERKRGKNCSTFCSSPSPVFTLRLWSISFSILSTFFFSFLFFFIIITSLTSLSISPLIPVPARKWREVRECEKSDFFHPQNRFEGARHSGDAVTFFSFLVLQLCCSEEEWKKKKGRETDLREKEGPVRGLEWKSSRKEFYRFRKEWKGRETETRWESSVFFPSSFLLSFNSKCILVLFHVLVALYNHSFKKHHHSFSISNVNERSEGTCL